MLKIKADRINELEKFGFKKYIDKTELGTEYGYKYEIPEDQCTFSVATKRENWEWNGSYDIYELKLTADDYEVFPDRKTLAIFYKLIKAGMVEEVMK